MSIDFEHTPGVSSGGATLSGFLPRHKGIVSVCYCIMATAAPIAKPAARRATLCMKRALP
jgi:hypothetical protein